MSMNKDSEMLAAIYHLRESVKDAADRLCLLYCMGEQHHRFCEEPRHALSATCYYAQTEGLKAKSMDKDEHE